jgi:tetratricopeptide (TPR) repeat protein
MDPSLQDPQKGKVVPSPNWLPAKTGRLYDVTMARQVAWGRPVGPSTVFAPEVNPIHVWFKIEGLGQGTIITAVWYFTSTEKPTEIGQGSVAVTSLFDWGEFNFELPKDNRWPVGNYRVELLVNGQPAAEVSFRVAVPEAGSPKPPTPKAIKKPQLDLKGEPEGFREELALLDKIKKDPSPANIYALALTQMATKKKDEDAFRLAFLYAQSATELSSGNADYWSFLGQLYENMGEGALNEIMAEDALQKAVELNPQNDIFRLVLGKFYFRNEIFSSALKQFEMVLSRNPKRLSPSIISAMGSAYLFDSQYSRGVKFFRKLLEDQPEADSARLALAILAHQQKDTLLATGELNKIITRSQASQENRNYALKLLEEWKKEKP